jgi:nucleoside-diphosphate-sugar epimerase
MSRSRGVDVIAGDGLAEALVGAEAIVDAATGPSPEEQAATEFFTTAARNLQEAGQQAGVERIVVVSIIGSDRVSGGYGAAKVAHEQATLTGPIPARVLRAAQFHEFVAQLMEWGARGEVTYVTKMRTQLVAARTVAQALADLATSANGAASAQPPILEIAGPREERLVEMATLLAARRGEAARIEETNDPADQPRRSTSRVPCCRGPEQRSPGPRSRRGSTRRPEGRSQGVERLPQALQRAGDPRKRERIVASQRCASSAP